MIAISQEPPKMTSEEYLAWEINQDIRYEYINGEIFAMTGTRILHNDVTLNLYRPLYSHLYPQGCRVNVSDMKVQVSPNSVYFYPELVVSCHPEDIKARKLIQHPKLIVEVLSPSTTSRDKGEKFRHYLKMPSLQEYILIDPDRMYFDRYCRGEGRMWFYYPYITGDIITLSSIEFEIPIELLYEGIELENIELEAES